MTTSVRDAPGERFGYTNAGPQLLSGVLSQVTGNEPIEFADRTLFKPLGIAKRLWGRDPQGNLIGAAHLSLRPQDTAKLGCLYLHQGVWKNEQIIPSGFIRSSTQQQKSGGLPEAESYGYMWWVSSVAGHPAYFVGGYGGQYLYVVADLDLVIVISSLSDRAHGENRILVEDFIVPSVLD
jgi:CubicO group peptidase (beta-lactamase class C family)